MRRISFPSGIPMHLYAHQPQQGLAALRALNLRCGHESHSQNSAFEQRSRQIAIFCGGLPYHAPVRRDLGEVRRINSNFSYCLLELRWAMKQIRLGQFDPRRLLRYLLSRLVDAHAARKSGSGKIGAEQAQVLCSPTRTSGQILETAERRWPSRYY